MKLMTMIVVLMVSSVGFAKAKKPYAKMKQSKAFTTSTSHQPLSSATCANRVNTELGSNTNVKKSFARTANRNEGRDQKH